MLVSVGLIWGIFCSPICASWVDFVDVDGVVVDSVVVPVIVPPDRSNNSQVHLTKTFIGGSVPGPPDPHVFGPP